MNIRFDKLFSIGQVHAYYEGACHDIGFLLPRETQRVLRGGRLIAKTVDDVLHVLFEADEAGAPLCGLPGQTLRIGLLLRNPQFGNYTTPAVDPLLGVPLYTNVDISTQLGAPTPTKLEPELAHESVIGVVDITIAAGFYGNAPSFQLTFGARSQPLKYYVVSNDVSDLQLLTVADAGFAADERPQISFDKVAPAQLGPGDIPAAMLGDASKQIVLFKSQAAVARRARGRKRIQLLRNNDVLIENLPQPGANAQGADVIVHVTKP